MFLLLPSDWKNTKGYVEILRPFNRSTKIEEGVKYVTLSTVIPVISILYELTSSYSRDRNHNRFGIGFAKNILSSLEDKFGKYPHFMLKKTLCIATFSDPRFAWVYFTKKREMESVRSDII